MNLQNKGENKEKKKREIALNKGTSKKKREIAIKKETFQKRKEEKRKER